MGMTAKTCSRLPGLRRGQALFLLSWAAYATAYVGRYNYPAVMGAVTAEGTLSLSAAGAVSTGYFICYALGQIVCGGLSQYLSPYAMIFAGLVLSGVCNLGMGALLGGAGLRLERRLCAMARHGRRHTAGKHLPRPPLGAVCR